MVSVDGITGWYKGEAQQQPPRELVLRSIFNLLSSPVDSFLAFIKERIVMISGNVPPPPSLVGGKKSFRNFLRTTIFSRVCGYSITSINLFTSSAVTDDVIKRYISYTCLFR